MTNLLNIEPWWRFGVALLIGALVGLEREFTQQKTGEPDFAGIRTFSLIGLLGAVTALLVTEFESLAIALVALGGLILLTVASYLGDVIRTMEEDGITTEVSVMLAYLLGAMVVWDMAEIAIALAVITALLLSLKGSLHEAIRRMHAEDLRVTLQFGLVAAVVLPLLPDRALDPLGVINPFQVWKLVVFISGIGFAGYVLMKVLGAEHGINLAGLLGGLVSSTATTLSFSTRSKETPALSSHFAQAIVITSSVMFPRIAIEVLAVYPPLLRYVIVPLAAMLGAGVVIVILMWRRHAQEESVDDEKAVELANPLKLTTAIMFGLVFAVVLIVVEIAQDFFGAAGVYAASVITGLTDVDAITLSVSELAGDGQLAPQVAGTAIIIAALTNTIVKAGIAYSVGSPTLRRVIIRMFGVIVIVGVISVIVLQLLG
jgi:uncharacterized membrane protein (DUF4010 family)